MKFDMSRRRRRARGGRRDRAAAAAGPRGRASSARPRTCRSGRAMKPGRHRARAERHDDRGQQHRRRGPARARRLPRATPSTQGAERLVDLATLTGAIIVALGSTLRRADGQRRRAGPPRSPRPAQRDRRARLAAAAARRVRRADQGHATPTSSTRAEARKAGAITAPQFLHALRRRRARGRTSTSPAGRRLGRAYAAKGGSGYGVRLLVELARRHASAGA